MSPNKLFLTSPLFMQACIYLLRGTIVNRTYGAHKALPGIYLSIFTNNIWSYLLWSPVIVVSSLRLAPAATKSGWSARSQARARVAWEQFSRISTYTGIHYSREKKKRRNICLIPSVGALLRHDQGALQVCGRLLVPSHRFHAVWKLDQRLERVPGGQGSRQTKERLDRDEGARSTPNRTSQNTRATKYRRIIRTFIAPFFFSPV